MNTEKARVSDNISKTKGCFVPPGWELNVAITQSYYNLEKRYRKERDEIMSLITEGRKV